MWKGSFCAGVLPEVLPSTRCTGRGMPWQVHLKNTLALTSPTTPLGMASVCGGHTQGRHCQVFSFPEPYENLKRLWHSGAGSELPQVTLQVGRRPQVSGTQRPGPFPLHHFPSVARLPCLSPSPRLPGLCSLRGEADTGARLQSPLPSREALPPGNRWEIPSDWARALQLGPYPTPN